MCRMPEQAGTRIYRMGGLAACFLSSALGAVDQSGSEQQFILFELV
jgi:hypothetical protein